MDCRTLQKDQPCGLHFDPQASSSYQRQPPSAIAHSRYLYICTCIFWCSRGPSRRTIHASSTCSPLLSALSVQCSLTLPSPPWTDLREAGGDRSPQLLLPLPSHPLRSFTDLRSTCHFASRRHACMLLAITLHTHYSPPLKHFSGTNDVST